jgi:hypothetical protein
VIKGDSLEIQTRYEQAIEFRNKYLWDAGPRSNNSASQGPGHINALLCLRDSLANLNQLIYQSIFQPNLQFLNQDDIVSYAFSTTASGSGMSIMYLLSRGLLLIESTDLILVSTQPDYGLKNRLCRIERQKMPIGDFGKPSYIEVRTVDDNLNSYGALIR